MIWRGRPWMALLPLVLGLLAWWLWWDHAAGQWQAGLEAALGERPRVIGFPYRLQADVGPLSLARAHGGAGFEARAATVSVERAFGRPWPHVFAAQQLVLRADAAAPAQLTLGMEAERARGSLDLGAGRLDRLSLELADARLALGWLRRSVLAPEAEIHLRQAPGAPPPADGRPGPVAELVVSSPAAQVGAQGAPLTLSLRATLIQRGALTSVRDWAEHGGALRIDELVLADSTGPVLRLSGSVAPGPGGALALAAAITTPCPATVLAAFAGRMPAPEYRRRVPVSIALAGAPGRPTATPSAEALAARPVKAQEPPCPRLAG